MCKIKIKAKIILPITMRQTIKLPLLIKNVNSNLSLTKKTYSNTKDRRQNLLQLTSI